MSKHRFFPLKSLPHSSGQNARNVKGTTVDDQYLQPFVLTSPAVPERQTVKKEREPVDGDHERSHNFLSTGQMEVLLLAAATTYHRPPQVH
jgi:hypothetical protein